jgi:hypothetical protein
MDPKKKTWEYGLEWSGRECDTVVSNKEHDHEHFGT